MSIASAERRLTSRHFDFIEHWDEQQKCDAVGITIKLTSTYTAWLEDPISDALIGIKTAYNSKGVNLLPDQLNGYIRAYLKHASEKKQRFVNTCRDHTTKSGKTIFPAKEIYILPEPDEADVALFLRDVKSILTENEYTLFVEIYVHNNMPKANDAAERKRRKRTHDRILKKLKEGLYGIQ